MTIPNKLLFLSKFLAGIGHANLRGKINLIFKRYIFLVPKRFLLMPVYFYVEQRFFERFVLVQFMSYLDTWQGSNTPTYMPKSPSSMLYGSRWGTPQPKVRCPVNRFFGRPALWNSEFFFCEFWSYVCCQCLVLNIFFYKTFKPFVQIIWLRSFFLCASFDFYLFQ